jgi:RHS repeat-associated protein
VDNGPAGTITTTHDTEGNLLNDGRYTYTWDAKNRMTSVTLGADTWSFQYDGLNRRFLEAQPNMEKIWVWQDTKPLMMKQSDGVTLRFWHGGYEIDDPQLVTPRKMLHVHDHLESVRVVINEASGQIESSWGYGPTGKRTAFVTGHEELFGYCSHEQHPSGLSLALFRTLNPNSGCWVSRDPFMEDVSLNLYSLASGNPVNQADPLGLETYEQFQARCQARAKASCASKGRNLKTWGTVRLGAGSGYRGDTLFVWSSFACTYECGSCSPEEQQRRQALKNAACAKEHSCSCGMGRVKLLEYTRNAYACYEARLNVMHCFDGGDSAHRSQADAAFRAFQNCAYLLSSSSRP